MYLKLNLIARIEEHMQLIRVISSLRRHEAFDLRVSAISEQVWSVPSSTRSTSDLSSTL